MSKTGEKKTKIKVWKVLFAVFVILLLAAVIKRITKPADAVVTAPLPTVTVDEPQTGDIEIETSLVGQLAPGDVYYVMPKVAGEIREIYVDQGDTVNEGDAICRIDNQKQIDAAKIALESAQVAVNNAQDTLATARTNLDRMTALLQTGDISSQAYEQTKSGYDQASAGVESAKLQLQSAQLQYDTQVEYSVVTAPVSGRIESESMELNAMASQSSQLCVISGNGAKTLKFSVTDRMLPAFSVGNEIRVEKQGQTYEGSVTAVPTIVDQATGLYQIEANVADGGSIPAGASVKVYFISDKADEVMTIPTDAVYYDGGKNYVYTLTYIDESDIAQDEAGSRVTIMDGNRAGTVHKVEVETGLSDTERTEIVSGISDADLVITSWTNQLYEGAQVQVLNADAKAQSVGADEAETAETSAQTEAAETAAE